MLASSMWTPKYLYKQKLIDSLEFILCGRKVMPPKIYRREQSRKIKVIYTEEHIYKKTKKKTKKNKQQKQQNNTQ